MIKSTNAGWFGLLVGLVCYCRWGILHWAMLYALRKKIPCNEAEICNLQTVTNLECSDALVSEGSFFWQLLEVLDIFCSLWWFNWELGWQIVSVMMLCSSLNLAVFMFGMFLAVVGIFLYFSVVKLQTVTNWGCNDAQLHRASGRNFIL